MKNSVLVMGQVSSEKMRWILGKISLQISWYFDIMDWGSWFGGWMTIAIWSQIEILKSKFDSKTLKQKYKQKIQKKDVEYTKCNINDQCAAIMHML